MARLSDDEARHLSQVLRLAVGDEVAVFDGAGREFRARVERVEPGRRGPAAARGDARRRPSPPCALTLAQAVIKGEKMDDVVRDATMMGVAAIEPLVTEHTAAHMKAGRAPERWRRIAIASAKQCRRAVVPAIGAGHRVPGLAGAGSRRDAGAAGRAVRRRRRASGVDAERQPAGVGVADGGARRAAGAWRRSSGRPAPAACRSRSAAGRCAPTPSRSSRSAILQFLWGDL